MLLWIDPAAVAVLTMRQASSTVGTSNATIKRLSGSMEGPVAICTHHNT